MLRTLFGIFVILHGLVHMWFVVLSRHWVPFEPEMGWTGKSWLFTPILGDTATRWVATILYTLVTITFVISGIGTLTRGEGWRPLMIASAAASAVMILLFWDGGTQYIVPKGLIGFLIDVGILVALLVLTWPPSRM
ncbi:MAG: hypothetical protein JXC32_05755 [Anaerolineae bacterium]|nr:hypothetical protein [Anaerolineae bacterium]